MNEYHPASMLKVTITAPMQTLVMFPPLEVAPDAIPEIKYEDIPDVAALRDVFTYYNSISNAISIYIPCFVDADPDVVTVLKGALLNKMMAVVDLFLKENHSRITEYRPEPNYLSVTVDSSDTHCPDPTVNIPNCGVYLEYVKKDIKKAE